MAAAKKTSSSGPSRVDPVLGAAEEVVDLTDWSSVPKTTLVKFKGKEPTGRYLAAFGISLRRAGQNVRVAPGEYLDDLTEAELGPLLDDGTAVAEYR